MKVKVLLVDDHPVVLQGLTAVFDALPHILLAGSATNLSEATQLLEQIDVDVAVIDLQLGDESGLTLLETMRREHPDVATVVFTMADGAHLDQRVRRAGAAGFVSKTDPVTALIDAIVDRGTAPRRAEGANLAPLSNREREVVQRLVEGESPSEIAAALDVAPSTVSTHLRRAKDKFQVRSVAELVRLWTA